MRAIQLYTAGIADAVLEGKASVPQVAVGEDEFVELDEEGNPRKKTPRTGRRPTAAVRRKAPARRRPVAPPAPVAAAAEPGAEDLDVEVDEAEVAEDVVAGAPGARRGAPAAGRRKGRGGDAAGE